MCISNSKCSLEKRTFIYHELLVRIDYSLEVGNGCQVLMALIFS